MWKRKPNEDKRVTRGDEFDGDAWHRAEDNCTQWTVPGTVPWTALDRDSRKLED